MTSDSHPEISTKATGADSMRIGLFADTGTVIWKPYESIDSIDITSGGVGPKYIHIQFKDVAGNRSAWSADTTIYDLTAPAGGIAIRDNRGYTSDPDPVLIINGAGADSMRLGMYPDTASSFWMRLLWRIPLGSW